MISLKDRRSILVIILVAAASLAAWVLSGAIHEYGHAIAVTALGGQVAEIQPFVLAGRPHVSYRGPIEASMVQFIHVSGMLASVTVASVLALLVPWQRLRPLPRLLVANASLIMATQLLAWAVLPVLMMLGVTVSDDATKFVSSSGLSPLVVSLSSAVALILLIWLIFLRSSYKRTLWSVTRNPSQ